MELREEQALLLERVHGGRAHDGIAKARVVAVADVIRHHEDNVRLLRGDGMTGATRDDAEQPEERMEQVFHEVHCFSVSK